MVHHVYRVENECLVRFSLLPGGAVKKAQVLGKDVRLMAFEWTHLLCHREVYEEMVERMELKVGRGLNEKTALAQIGEKYGFAGRSGFLHPGTTEDRVGEILSLGKPAEKTDKAFVWNGVSGDFRVRFTGKFEDGKLRRFDEYGGVEHLAPVEGTFSWVEAELSDENSTASAVDLMSALEKNIDGKTGWDLREWYMLANQLIEGNEGIDTNGLLGKAIKNSEGTSDELEFFQSTRRPKLTEWVQTSLQKISMTPYDEELAVSGFGETTYFPAQDATAMLDWLFENDEGLAREGVEQLLKTKRAEFLIELVDFLPKFEPAFAEKLVVGILATADVAKNGGLIYRTVEKIPVGKYSENGKEKISAIINELPEGEEGGDWHDLRKEVLEFLSVKE